MSEGTGWVAWAHGVGSFRFLQGYCSGLVVGAFLFALGGWRWAQRVSSFGLVVCVCVCCVYVVGSENNGRGREGGSYFGGMYVRAWVMSFGLVFGASAVLTCDRE